MIHTLFSDPHLGLSRQANTTRDSAKRLQTALYDVLSVIQPDDGLVVCGGDLFDKYNNSEEVILQGISAAEGVVILGGNHDESNRASARSSLDIVGETTKVVNVWVGETHSEKVEPFILVPHHSTQELFDAALKDAEHRRKQVEGHCALVVHCNRGSLPGEKADSTLLITEEREAELLQTFTRIFYGHIHEPSTNPADRAIQMGNTHPTGFGDISNKYFWTWDDETDELDKHLLWDESLHSLVVPLGAELYPSTEIQFVEATGAGTRKEVAEYLQAIWKAYPQAYAVRFKGEYTDNVSTFTAEATTLETLADVIEAELATTDLADLYQEIRSSL